MCISLFFCDCALLTCTIQSATSIGCDEDRLSNHLQLKIIIWYFYWELSLYTQNPPLKKLKILPQKVLSRCPMAPRKETVTLNGATSKGKAISTIGGTVPSLVVDEPRTTEKTDSSSFRKSWKYEKYEIWHTGIQRGNKNIKI